MTVDSPNSSADGLARALELCDRALDHLDVRDKPNGERPSVDEVIVLVEAVRTELVTILQNERLDGTAAPERLSSDR